jgi:hypothetical protein
MERPTASGALVERRANATFGPDRLVTGYPLRYLPRWSSDRHPWIDPFSRLRWAHHEVVEQGAA